MIQKMEQKQRLFIYDRKEMGVLFLLGIVVAAFAFTLGVHLGKKVGAKPIVAAPETAPATTVADKLPDRYEITEQSKGAQQAADESLNQALHDEVGRTGIKLDVPRQVALPDKAKSKNAGATSLKHAQEDESAAAAQVTLQSIPAALRPTPDGHFTLQIGSYPGIEEARDQVEALEALGLKPFLRVADVRKSKWYRVFVGGYDTKHAAEQAGQRYRSQHVIDAFIVAKMSK